MAAGKTKEKEKAKPATAPAAAQPPSNKAFKASAAPEVVPAKSVKPGKFDAEFEPLPVPESGPLNLEQLIQLGIYNNLKVLKARTEADIAVAERKKATDLKDPEIRISYSKQTDVEVGDPYTEYTKGLEIYRGSEVVGENSIGYGGFAGESRSEYERTNFNEKRYRSIERRVVPGATRDKIVTTEYEKISTSSRTNQLRNDISVDRTGNNAGTITNTIGGNNIVQNRNRKIVGRTVTYVNHDDDTRREDQYSIMLRFPLPNPFEMRANVQRANADIKAKNYAVKAEEDQLIVEIRSLYEDLAYYEAQSNAFKALSSHQSKFTELAKLIAPDKIAQAAGSANQSIIDSGEAELRAGMLRAELARLVGLRDLDRISVPKSFRQRIVDAKAMDENYLLQMASVYRSDLQQLHAEHEVARSEYKMERALKIPVASGLDFAYGRNSDIRGRDANEWEVRFTVSLPLWSWLNNDADKVPLAAARGYSRQIGRLQENIAGDIHSSLNLLRLVQTNLEAYEKSSAALQLLMKNEGTAGAFASKNPQEVISESEEAVIKGSIQRLQIYRNYNRAVMMLEAALGTRLEKILTPQAGQ